MKQRTAQRDELERFRRIVSEQSAAFDDLIDAMLSVEHSAAVAIVFVSNGWAVSLSPIAKRYEDYVRARLQDIQGKARYAINKAIEAKDATRGRNT